MSDKKEFVLLGASFRNTGAQSMIFVTVSELRQRYKECEIHVLATSDCPKKVKEKLRFDYVLYPPYYELDGRIPFFKNLYMKTKGIVNRILYKNYISRSQYIKYIKRSTAVIDISGYALSSQWSKENCRRYLRRIELAKEQGTPIVLMPQSFGPFDYPSEIKDEMLDRISKILKIPEVIFVREHEGQEALKKLGVENLIYSKDIVLQNNKIYMENVFCTKVEVEDVLDTGEIGIAIIPNFHTISQEKNVILEIYKNIVDELLRWGEKVFVVRHSAPDNEICHAIKNIYSDVDAVVLLNDDYNSLEFEKMTQHFKFVIASRYHSIVHSYKNNVPCVIIGWAEKYRELAEIFEQEKYMFDVLDLKDINVLIKAVQKMGENYVKEKNIIESHMIQVNKESCFDKVYSILESKKSGE